MNYTKKPEKVQDASFRINTFSLFDRLATFTEISILSLNILFLGYGYLNIGIFDPEQEPKQEDN